MLQHVVWSLEHSDLPLPGFAPETLLLPCLYLLVLRVYTWLFSGPFRGEWWRIWNGGDHNRSYGVSPRLAVFHTPISTYHPLHSFQFQRRQLAFRHCCMCCLIGMDTFLLSFWGYAQLCFWFTPGIHQTVIWCQKLEPGSVTCKASSLSPVLPLQPVLLILTCIYVCFVQYLKEIIAEE